MNAAVKLKPEHLGRLAAESVKEQFLVITQAAEGADVLVAGGALQHATRSVAESINAHYVYASFCANTLPSPHHTPPAMLGRVPVNGTPEENLAQWEQQRHLFVSSRETLNAERAKLGLDPIGDVRDHIFGDAPWLAADPVLGPWPDDAEDCIAIGEVNQQALFRRVAAIVHHGGAGTTTTAAAAGTPQIVLPHMYDQYYWGNQIERLNIGRSAKSVTTETLDETLQLAEQATKVGTQVRTNGARVAAQRLMATQVNRAI